MLPKIYVLVPHSITEWLVKIAYSNHLYLRNRYDDFEVVTINVLLASELTSFSNVVPFSFNSGFELYIIPGIIERKLQHGYLLDKAIKIIADKLTEKDRLIICDSDFVLSTEDEIWDKENITYFSARPIKSLYRLNRQNCRLPHPCFIAIKGRALTAILEAQRQFSFVRRRDTYIGVDYKGNQYGADSVDYVIYNVLKKGYKTVKGMLDSYHFEGCTEIIRKYLKNKTNSFVNIDIVEFASDLDRKNEYHNENKYYYIKGLYSTIKIKNIKFNGFKSKDIVDKNIIEKMENINDIPFEKIDAYCKKVELRLEMHS